MKKKRSRKHHYLPVHYLKGFTDSEGCFYVYDKHTDSIFYTSPTGSFFENDLNTIVYPDGSASDFVEGLYTAIENQSWSYIDRIRSSTQKTPIALLDKMSFYVFLLFMHWRLPSNFKFIETLSEDFFRGNNVLDYYKLKSKTGEAVSKEEIERITSLPAFKKVAKLIIPYAPFFKDKNWSDQLDNWRFIYSLNSNNWFIVGDNPIVTRGHNDHDPIKCLHEFIFPVSGRILLVCTNRFDRKMVPPEFIFELSAAIFKRSQRFIACHRKDWLEVMIKDYRLGVPTNYIINELFGMLK
jgi:hypothetical protein